MSDLLRATLQKRLMIMKLIQNTTFSKEMKVLDVQERKEELCVDKGVIISRKEYKDLYFDLSVYEAVSDEEVRCI